MPNSKIIQGQIIRILDTKTIIINLGKNDGIRDDSLFSILGDPEPVVDTVSNEVLGLVSVVKGKVKASQVYDKFTIASTKWSSTRMKSMSIFGGQWENLFDTRVIDQGDLRVNPSDVKPWKAKSETPVKIGDTVEVEVRDPSIDSETTPEPTSTADTPLLDPNDEGITGTVS